jgi:hypothetical protein
MLSIKIRRVFLARHRVDFRRRFDGLLAEAFQLGVDPYDGDCVLFVTLAPDCDGAACTRCRSGPE